MRLRSGRRVRVTAGHNLFTLDQAGRLTKVRTQSLRPGLRVAVPGAIADPSHATPVIPALALVPDGRERDVSIEGPTVRRLFGGHSAELQEALHEVGINNWRYYLQNQRLPWPVARQFVTASDLGTDDRMRFRGARHTMSVEIPVTTDVAWLLGIYVAEGYRRRGQAVVTNTDGVILDRIEAAFARLSVPTYRSQGKRITGMSVLFSELLDWMGCGGKAAEKRVPDAVFGWPRHLIESFLEGFIDGDGSRRKERNSMWTTSSGLVSDLLLLLSRIRRAGVSVKVREGSQPLYEITVPHREHKLLTSAPLPDRLLVRLRESTGLSQVEAAAEAGYKHPTDLCNIENRSGREAVRRTTLARLQRAYVRHNAAPQDIEVLQRLLKGDLLWDEVVSVEDTGRIEPVYDLEVRPQGSKIENFLAGHGGVFVSNTAGFVDAGFKGHLTLELSNVSNLPIALYPGMPIGQLCIFRMTSPAERPYGSPDLGSKYQGQMGPTPSRYSENFRR